MATRDSSIYGSNNISLNLNVSTINNATDAGSNAKAIVASNVIQIIYLLIGTFGFFSNLYVILVIALYKPMHKQLTNTFILNQSIMDATVALFLFFTTLFPDDSRKRNAGKLSDEVICRLWFSKLPLWGMLVASTYGIVGLTLERFFAIVYPIWHKTTFTRSRPLISITIGSSWFIGLGYNLAYVIPISGITQSGDCTVYAIWPDSVTQEAVGVFTIVVQYLLPLFLLGYGYARMVLVLHRRVETAGDGPGHGTGPGGVVKEVKRNESMAKARSNVIKTLALIACSFILCWTCNQVSLLYI